LKNPRKSLKEIQESIALENKNSQEKELSEEELNIAWNLYIEELVKVNNHSAVSNFKQARLVITGDYRIEIITDNNLQQKFIEAERGELITHLRTYFNSRLITYDVRVEENLNKKDKEIHLSTRQQYQKIVENFPLVKELKDRLGLQLD